jgi:rare lipoprotein A
MLTNLLLTSSLFGVFGVTPKVEQSKPVHTVKEKCSSASWYGPGFHGRRTSNGETFNQYSLTAAHKQLPFGTRVRVTNRHNGKSIIVRINDRGPFIGGRALDLSKEAASRIGMIRSGHAPVCYSEV